MLLEETAEIFPAQSQLSGDGFKGDGLCIVLFYIGSDALQTVQASGVFGHLRPGNGAGQVIDCQIQDVHGDGFTFQAVAGGLLDVERRKPF